ncbi:MAG: hypothetical protein IIC71_14585 [Acidobacteria bacterium]|nr:hypothetical protein [Acidobacteriota bacterium]
MMKVEVQRYSIGSKLLRWFGVVIILTGVLANASAGATINDCDGPITVEAGGSGGSRSYTIVNDGVVGLRIESELPNGINATLTSTGTTNPWTAVLSVSASAAASPGSFTIQFLESGVSPADSCSQAVQVVTPTTTTTTTTTRPPVVTTTTTTTLPPTTTTTEPLVVTTTLSAVGPTGPTDDGGLPPLLPILGLVLVVALSGVLLSLRPDQAGFAARLRAVQSGGVVSRSQYGRRRTLGQWTSDLTGVSALARRKRVKGPSVGQRVKTSSIAKTVKKNQHHEPPSQSQKSLCACVYARPR